jgi:hypothetical protein
VSNGTTASRIPTEKTTIAVTYTTLKTKDKAQNSLVKKDLEDIK